MKDNAQAGKTCTQSLQPPEVKSVSDVEAVLQAVASIQYGVVQLIIQDGRIVQIDKTEKIRLA